MKRIFCPKCDKQLSFDEKKYPEARSLAFVCTACGHQFKIHPGRKTVRTAAGGYEEVKEPDYALGYIRVIENAFGYQQTFPLIAGDNVIGRRNKDTDGVDIEIITADPSVARKHCVIAVKARGAGEYDYVLRDFPSLTGTFIGNYCLGKKEQVRLESGAVVTVGATTFIVHEAGEKPDHEDE